MIQQLLVAVNKSGVENVLRVDGTTKSLAAISEWHASSGSGDQRRWGANSAPQVLTKFRECFKKEGERRLGSE